MATFIEILASLKANKTLVNAGLVAAPIVVTGALEVFEPHYLARLIVAGVYGACCAYGGKKYL